jgi:hypothetical protein
LAGPRAKNTVIGHGKRTNIVDDVQNNVIVGVNNMGNADIGSRVKEAIQQAIEAKKTTVP